MALLMVCLAVQLLLYVELDPNISPSGIRMRDFERNMTKTYKVYGWWDYRRKWNLVCQARPVAFGSAELRPDIHIASAT